MRLYRLTWRGECPRYTPTLGASIRQLILAYPGIQPGALTGTPAWAITFTDGIVEITGLFRFDEGSAALKNILRHAMPWTGILTTVEDDMGVA